MKHLVNFLIILLPFIGHTQSYICDIGYFLYGSDFGTSPYKVNFKKGIQSLQWGDNYEFNFGIEKGKQSTDSFSLIMFLSENEDVIFSTKTSGIENNADSFEGYIEYGNTKYTCNCAKENKIQGCKVSAAAYNNGFSEPIFTTFPGNSNFENHFYDHVDKLISEMNLSPSQIPKIKIYKDGIMPNARAIAKGYNNYEIIFGENMILNHVFPTGDLGEHLNTTEMQAILAHEFGHIGQYINGVDGPTKDTELMADVMSGWYVGLLVSMDGQIQVESGIKGVPNVRIAMENAYNTGDYLYNSPDHHGTPQMRMDAFIYGVKLSLQNGIKSWDVAFDLARRRYNL